MVKALARDSTGHEGQAQVKFYATDGSGNITSMSQHDWLDGWDVIVPGNFGGSGYTDLLFYRRRDGLGTAGRSRARTGRTCRCP